MKPKLPWERQRQVKHKLCVLKRKQLPLFTISTLILFHSITGSSNLSETRGPEKFCNEISLLQ